MTPDLDHRLDLTGQILCLLREYPEGLSEHQLIQPLRARHLTHIPHRELADKPVLFRTHFLLFNALYHLRDHLWAEREAHLEISPLNLCLHPCVGGMQALEQGDPLRDYYPDPHRPGEASEADVERLLQSSWTCMQGSEEKAVALVLFELEDAVDCPATKLRYRQLVSQYHPDRGDSTVRLQSTNRAMEILRRCYSWP